MLDSVFKNTMKTTALLVIWIYSLSSSLYGNGNNLQRNNFSKKHNELIFKNNFIPDSMLKATNKEIVLLYLKRYENKDLKGIEDIFSNDIALRDWKIRVVGKENALIETRKNFESVKSIRIDVLSIYENKNTVAAELKIIINGSEELYVIDVITINAERKINSIKAFIGRGDE